MANTTWNPADKTAVVSLSGGNLIASAAVGANGVRAIDQQASGKFYWECRVVPWSGANSGIGFCSRSSVLGDVSATPAGACNIIRSGIIFVNGTTTGLSLGSLSSSSATVAIAVDLTAQLAWMRVAPAGNWNGSGTANPATAVGGASLASIAGVYPMVPVCAFGASETITANFGDSAFVGAVPAGFTAGWPAPAVSPQVVLLCHCDGTNGSTTFTDVSSSAHPLTPTAVTVSTTLPKFGTGSASFTAANSAIDVSNYGDFQFGAAPFTVEAWAYFTTTPSGTQCIVAQWPTAGSLGWTFRMNSGSLAFFYSTTGSDFPGISATFTPTLNTWYHLAADRDASNMLRIYVNGAVLTSGAAAVTIFASVWNCIIGNDIAATRGFPGRLDEIRITKGQAQYGGAFTPPTAPFGGAAASAQDPRVMVIA